MHYSVNCHEDVPFESYEEMRALAVDLPRQIRDHYVKPFIFELCESWASGVADPVENDAVVSDVPALVLSGQYDPITPPVWGRLAAETLKSSFFYEFPGVGHGVMRSNGCALSLGLQFLDDPTTEPDASCIDDLSDPVFQ
jgi:pimeloyl-ACP methyl ester carboxylesterase